MPLGYLHTSASRPTAGQTTIWTIAATPTTTITPRSSAGREPPADLARRAARRPRRRRRGGAPGAHATSATRDEEHGGDAVDERGEHVLERVEPLQVLVGDRDPHQREQDDPLRRAEVAAVDAGAEDARPQQRAAVRARARRAARRPSARAAAAATTSTSAIAISTGTIASKADSGSVSSSTAPVMPPSTRRDAQPQHALRAGRRAPPGSRSRPRPSPGRARRCCSRWRRPAGSRSRAAPGT